jgi:proteasome lid subunit RPN8/RPN11
MLRMPKHLAEAIREHGRETYKDEACGVLYGRVEEEHKEVVEIEPLANSRDGQRHRRFLITPNDYRRAEAEAFAKGINLVGFYHSHPNHPAYPSGYDLEHAWPFFSYVIVSVREGEPKEVRSFVMEEDRATFAEEEIQFV